MKYYGLIRPIAKIEIPYLERRSAYNMQIVFRDMWFLF